MTVRVRLFATIRDIVGKDVVSLSFTEGATASSIVDLLVRQYPKLGEWKSYARVAVNWEYVEGDEQVHDNDEVAVIPPVSGG